MRSSRTSTRSCSGDSTLRLTLSLSPSLTLSLSLNLTLTLALSLSPSLTLTLALTVTLGWTRSSHTSPSCCATWTRSRRTRARS